MRSELTTKCVEVPQTHLTGSLISRHRNSVILNGEQKIVILAEYDKNRTVVNRDRWKRRNSTAIVFKVTSETNRHCCTIDNIISFQWKSPVDTSRLWCRVETSRCMEFEKNSSRTKCTSSITMISRSSKTDATLNATYAFMFSTTYSEPSDT